MQLLYSKKSEKPSVCTPQNTTQRKLVGDFPIRFSIWEKRKALLFLQRLHISERGIYMKRDVTATEQEPKNKDSLSSPR